MQRVYQVNQNGTPITWGNGNATFAVAAGAVTAQKTTAAGTICRAIVTTTGTASASPGTVFYNGTDNTGIIVGAIPGNATLGQSFTFMMPVAAAGIYVVNPANGPASTVSYE